MALIPKPGESRSLARDWFAEPRELEDTLERASVAANSEWEETFVEDLQSSFARFRLSMALSERQYDKLNEIIAGD